MYKKLLILKVSACLLFTGFSLNAGVLEQLFWDNVFNSEGGRTTAVEDLRAFPGFPDSPVDSLDLDTAVGFSTPRGQGDDFGSLIKGYIVSPISGDITFYTASDDNSEFLLSSDDDPANLQLLGKETGCCTGLFDGARLDERSGTVTLETGGIYYFEALYQEGGGGDWMDIGWELPDGTQEIIPVGALLPAPSPTRPAGPPQADFLHFPVDHFVSESTLVSFRVDLFGSVAGMKFQWKKNGADIAGATLPWITLIAELADDGALFTLNVKSDASGANGVDFDGGSIFVEADIDAPEILGVNSSAEPHGFIVQYNELVTEATATDLGNYTFSGQTIDVQGVRMLDGASVVIETANFTDEATSLRISGIKDLSEAGNTVTATTIDIAFALPGALYLFYEGNPINMYPAADRGKGLYPLTFNPFDASVMGNQDNFSARASSTMPYLEVPNTGDITVNPDGNVQDQYGILMIGYIVPKVTATYHFYIASDDNAFLYLSTDENPENTIEIARENVWNAVRDWNGTDGDVNKSPTEHPNGFDLTAGQRYYFEAINQEGGGGDNFAIAWNTTGIAPETGDGSQIITGEFLQSAVNSGELSIDVQPVSTVGTEGKAATFSVQVSGSDPLAFNYVWYKNDEPVRGETEAEYTLEVLGQEDNNAQLRVEVFNTNGTYSRLVSDTVELTVDNDVLAPEIVTVNADPLKANVIVVFNEDVDAASVENTGAYSIIAEDGSELSVTGATFDGTRQVVINTAEQGDGVIYTLTVNGATDISGNANSGNPSKNFSSYKFGPGGLTVLFYEDGGAGITFYDEPRGINVFPENYNQFGAASPPGEGTIGAIAARESHVATYFETPATGNIDTAPQSDVSDNYGAILFGYLQPEVTGTYRFFLAVDDNAELYLSTDENPANSQLIAAEASWSQVRTWANREPAKDELFDGPEGTTSDPIDLVADQRYYIEGVFSEGGGGDNFAVAWSFTSDGTDPGRPPNGSNPIPGEFLLSNLPVFLTDDDVIIDITQQPIDQIGVLASQGLPLVSNDFNSSDGGYTVETEGEVPGPWVYDAASGSDRRWQRERRRRTLPFTIEQF
ncbi:MAG TPA: hypothetical protein EYQ50_27330 [Verrucomicrobiales bacterium]|nr:hypothetical protein [Verrucomicrobiales bacterium]